MYFFFLFVLFSFKLSSEARRGIISLERAATPPAPSPSPPPAGAPPTGRKNTPTIKLFFPIVFPFPSFLFVCLFVFSPKPGPGAQLGALLARTWPAAAPGVPCGSGVPTDLGRDPGSGASPLSPSHQRCRFPVKERSHPRAGLSVRTEGCSRRTPPEHPARTGTHMAACRERSRAWPWGHGAVLRPSREIPAK